MPVQAHTALWIGISDLICLPMAAAILEGSPLIGLWIVCMLIQNLFLFLALRESTAHIQYSHRQSLRYRKPRLRRWWNKLLWWTGQLLPRGRYVVIVAGAALVISLGWSVLPNLYCQILYLCIVGMLAYYGYRTWPIRPKQSAPVDLDQWEWYALSADISGPITEIDLADALCPGPPASRGPLPVQDAMLVDPPISPCSSPAQPPPLPDQPMIPVAVPAKYAALLDPPTTPTGALARGAIVLAAVRNQLKRHWRQKAIPAAYPSPADSHFSHAMQAGNVD